MFKKAKNFSTIMDTFIKTKTDLEVLCEDIKKRRDYAEAEAQRQVDIANACTVELIKAERATESIGNLLSE